MTKRSTEGAEEPLIIDRAAAVRISADLAQAEGDELEHRFRRKVNAVISAEVEQRFRDVWSAPRRSARASRCRVPPSAPGLSYQASPVAPCELPVQRVAYRDLERLARVTVLRSLCSGPCCRRCSTRPATVSNSTPLKARPGGTRRSRNRRRHRRRFDRHRSRRRNRHPWDRSTGPAR